MPYRIFKSSASGPSRSLWGEAASPEAARDAVLASYGDRVSYHYFETYPEDDAADLFVALGAFGEVFAIEAAAA